MESVIRCDPGVIRPIWRKMTLDEKTSNISKSESFKFILLYSETCIKRTPSGNAVSVRLIQGVRLIQLSIDNVI